MDKRTKKTLSVDNAVIRMGKYCSYTERSIDEVKKKLKTLGVSVEDTQLVMERLTKMGFLNESRFASAFVSGKFRMKKWGKKRIEMEMKRKGVSNELIEKGISGLSQEEYIEALDTLLQKKWNTIARTSKETDDYEAKQRQKQKLIRFALQKGYEMDLVFQRVKVLGL